jgi:integrase
MPAQKRHRTKYPGVYYIVGKAVATGKPDKIFYIDYYKGGKRIQEKAGRRSEDMTPARAAQKRADKIKGRILPNKVQREAEKAAKKAEEGRWTISKLWTAYKAAKPNLKGWKTGTYDSLYNKHIEPNFGSKEPKDIMPLDVKRVENRLLKTHSPQMVKHVLKHLRLLCNFGKKNGLCPGLSFTIEMPAVDNETTEDLTPEQMGRLLKAIEADNHPHAGPMMLMALYTGMRRGEMFRLEWRDLDFTTGFILLRDPKGGRDQKIPMNEPARNLLSSHLRRRGSPYVFPGRAGQQRTRIDKAVNVIKKAAKLPKNFRALHGLRHVFASTLASSGQVDLYTLQKLLTHKTPGLTQRYSHLRDSALKRASELAGEIVTGVATESSNAKVIEIAGDD